jgi:hypothetical protein
MTSGNCDTRTCLAAICVLALVTAGRIEMGPTYSPFPGPSNVGDRTAMRLARPAILATADWPSFNPCRWGSRGQWSDVVASVPPPPSSEQGIGCPIDDST